METVIRYFKITLLVAICIIPYVSNGQSHSVALNFRKLVLPEESIRHYERAMEISKSGNARLFMTLRGYLGANNSIIEKHKDNSIIEYQWLLIENLINSAEVSRDIYNNKSPFRDEFKGWVSTSNNGLLNNEVPLYESYSFFYIAQFLYYLKNNGWRDESSNNFQKWNNLLLFVENDVWTKWYKRSLTIKGNNYWYFLRGRTHMGSHWAGVAMYLIDVSKDKKIQQQATILVAQYDKLLRSNLKIKGRGYIWNSTYDDVRGTFASKSPENVIQDVSHGNHVVSYVVAAYQIGNRNWNRGDLDKFKHTIKDFVYDGKSNTFRDNVDGTTDKNRPGWGNFVGDGWVKLAEYDEELRCILKTFGTTKMLRRYGQEIQFKASLYKDVWEDNLPFD